MSQGRLHIGTEVAGVLLRRRLGVYPGLIDQLQHVLFLVSRSGGHARKKLTCLEAVEPERSSEAMPGHCRPPCLSAGDQGEGSWPVCSISIHPGDHREEPSRLEEKSGAG